MKRERPTENRYLNIRDSCNNKNYHAFAVCIRASFVLSFSSCTTIIINVHFSFIQWEMILSYFHSYNFQKVVYNSETHGQYRFLTCSSIFLLFLSHLHNRFLHPQERNNSCECQMLSFVYFPFSVIFCVNSHSPLRQSL